MLQPMSHICRYLRLQCYEVTPILITTLLAFVVLNLYYLYNYRIIRAGKWQSLLLSSILLFLFLFMKPAKWGGGVFCQLSLNILLYCNATCWQRSMDKDKNTNKNIFTQYEKQPFTRPFLISGRSVF